MNEQIKTFKQNLKNASISLNKLTLTRKFLRYSTSGNGINEIHLLYWDSKNKYLRQVDYLLKSFDFKLNKSKIDFIGTTNKLDALQCYFPELKQLAL